MVFFILLLVAVILWLSYQLYQANERVSQKAKEQYEAWKQTDYEYIKREQKNMAQQEIKLTVAEQVAKKAQEQYEIWCSQDRERIINEQKHLAMREAEVLLQQWLEENTQSIRQEAIQRSQSVIKGKVTEHFIPFLPEFIFNPKDARFIGSPVDFVVFDGLDEDNLQEILFMEIKTGSSSLNKRQRQIKEAVQSGRVRWIELRKHG